MAKWVRWLVALVAALLIVGLLAWARNDPGVGHRDPDPPSGARAVVVQMSQGEAV